MVSLSLFLSVSPHTRTHKYARLDKSKFTVVSMQNTELILVLLFNNYCIIFHTNNCKPTFAHPVYTHTYVCVYIHIAISVCTCIYIYNWPLNNTSLNCIGPVYADF